MDAPAALSTFQPEGGFLGTIGGSADFVDGLKALASQSRSVLRTAAATDWPIAACALPDLSGRTAFARAAARRRRAARRPSLGFAEVDVAQRPRSDALNRSLPG